MLEKRTERRTIVPTTPTSIPMVTWRFLFVLLAVALTSMERFGVSALSTRNSIRTQRHQTGTSVTSLSASGTSSSNGNSNGSRRVSIDGHLSQRRSSEVIEPLSGNDGSFDEGTGAPSGLLDRKQALRSAAAAVMASGMVLSARPAGAFDRSFPTELADDDSDSNTGVLIGSRSTAAQRRQKAVATKQKLDQNLASFSPKTDALPSLVWGLAIFFATGSRNTPLATPLANLIYSEESEPWLRDRNAGLFGPLPLPFLGLLGAVFLVLGTVTQYTLLQLSGGDSGVCGQLAGVALINGGFFEIGRIASGEKKMTKEENDRAVMLDEEFDDFARKRLQSGGNCHRSDIVRSFRRFNPKYRNENEQYPLTDREIERLLREWNETKNPYGKAEMRSSGFYYGIQINKEADVFF